jgi:hypothetical protein
MFDSGWAAAVAAIITALIVGGTAIAAFRQLRHGRNANDIVVYLRLIDFMDDPRTVATRQTLRKVAERVANDPVYLQTLRDPQSFPEEFTSVGEMLRFLEHICVLVTKGGVAESLVLAEYADTFVEMWDLCRPSILLRREALSPYLGRAFEHLAMRARRYIESGAMARDYNGLERDPRPFSITTVY